MKKSLLLLRSHSKMKVLTSFNYYKDKDDYFPIIPVIFSVNEQDTRTLALIDSGASISVFNEETADLLGLNVQKGKRTVLGGIKGRIVGYIHKIQIKIAGKSFICPVVFSRELAVSYNLLGREVFFENFKITFDEAQKRVILA